MMQTDIQWLLSLLLNYELSPEVKKLCLERIGEVEAKLNAQPQPQGKAPLVHHVVNPVTPVANAMAPVNAIPTVHSALANLGEISTGQNTRGPNKMRGRL